MFRLRTTFLLVALVVGFVPACKKTAAPPPPVPKPFDKVDWLRGDWTAQSGPGSEHWYLVGGALYGISFTADRFEIMVIDDAPGPGPSDGVLRLFAMPGGQPPVEFATFALADRSAKFANPKHDFPTMVTLRLDESNVLHGEASNGTRLDQVTFTRATAPSRAPELEELDRAFATSTAERGVDGWVAAFEPTGWMIRGKDRVEGPVAIRNRMKALLDNGTFSWAPIASGVHGSLGYTIGTAKFTATRGTGSFYTSYARIWAKQPDGTWKLRFDTDRAINN